MHRLMEASLSGSFEISAEAMKGLVLTKSYDLILLESNDFLTSSS
jgi:hypothetical protein